MSDVAGAGLGSGIAFWLRWLVATAIGLVLAFAMFVMIFSVIGSRETSCSPC